MTAADHRPGGLVRAAAAGDQGAWDALVEMFTGTLWGIARRYRLPPDDTADAVQTTWLKLVENLTRIKDPDRVAGWLATTIRNECLLTLRRTARETPLTEATTLPDLNQPPLDSELLRQEQRAQLRRGFAAMGPRCQQLLRLLLVTDPPEDYQHISATLGMPIGSIGPTRARCLAQLRRNLTGAGIEDRPLTSTKGQGRDGVRT